MEFNKEYKEYLESIRIGNYNSVPGNVKGYLIIQKLIKYDIQRESTYEYNGRINFKLTELGYFYLKGELLKE